MSSIAITGGATGTGVFSLLAPSTSTNRTLTLPDTTGTLLDSTGSTTLTNLTVTNGASIQGLTVGRGAGSVATNTAVGASALAANTSGANSVAVGYQAGLNNTTGDANVYIGRLAGFTGTTARLNTFVGDEAGGLITTGASNTFIGNDSGYGITTGSKNTIIGSYGGNSGGLDIRTASNYIVLSDGDGNPRLYIDSNGGITQSATGATIVSVGVYNQTSASASNLGVASNGVIYRSTSALKYKQNIRDLEERDISLLRPVRYKSKCEGDDQTKDHLGLIADEAADAGFEELVTRGADGEVEGFQYERLTVVLLKELQMLRARVAQLESNP